MSNFLQKTYLVCNSSLIREISKIDGFSINLGQALMNKQKNILHPTDICIQTHLLFFKEIILLYGYLGSLHVYSNNSYSINSLSVFNSQERIDMALGQSYNIFDIINKGLKEMAEKTGYNTSTEAPKKIEVLQEEYIKPNKQFNEMTDAERIAYARNRK